MRGPRPFRIFLMVILALTPLAQSFWFVRAWRVIDAVAWPGPRALLQGLWMVAALVVLAAALDMLRVRVLPRRAFGAVGAGGRRLWLIASCLGFLAVTAVGSLEWLSQSAMAALPVAQWARVEPARHTVFRYAAYLAGGLPFLAAVYGATVGRLRYRLVTVEVPIRRITSQSGWSAHRAPQRSPHRGLHAPRGDPARRRPDQYRAARSRRAHRRFDHRTSMTPSRTVSRS